MKEKPPGLEDREKENAKADETVLQTDMGCETGTEEEKCHVPSRAE